MHTIKSLHTIEVTKRLIKSVKLPPGQYEENLIEERMKKENSELENQKVHLMQDLNKLKVAPENIVKLFYDEIMECIRLAGEKDVTYVHGCVYGGNALKRKRKSHGLKERLKISLINDLEEKERKLVIMYLKTIYSF